MSALTRLCMSVIPCIVLLAIVLAMTDSTAIADEKKSIAESAEARAQLETLNDLIGAWRGVGQRRRGSSQGAWRQTGEFVWDFSRSAPQVKYLVTGGKLVQQASITFDVDAKTYRLVLTTPEDVTRTYQGDWKDGELVFVSPVDENGVAYRLTITPLNEKRTLVLHEKTTSTGTTFYRIAEVGATRAGTHLAVAGATSRECVVTGGTGTSTVTYQGETYYVCCSGCRQAFLDDPKGVIADFQERLRKRQAENK